jgi:LysR family glycine cleavage system transcriptional activator
MKAIIVSFRLCVYSYLALGRGKDKRLSLTLGVQKRHVLGCGLICIRCWCETEAMMPRTLPPLNALRAFEAAARLQSFTRAAAELNVSHSAISRHVRGLEKRLDVQLFKVAQRGVTLTELGRWYVAQITPLLDQIAIATEQVAEKPKGVITLSVEPSLAQKWLVPRLGGFYEQYPDVEIIITSTHEVVDVESHAVDMALRYFKETARAAGHSLVSDRPFYPYAAPSLVKTIGARVSPEGISKRWLITNYISELWPEWFQKAGLPEVPELKLTTPMKTLLTIEYAVAGQGIVLMSSDLVVNEVRDGKLVQLSDVGVQYGGYYLVANKTAARRKPVRALKAWILEQSAGLRD